MKRREFIILGGMGATSASLLSACGHPEEKLIPAFIPDEEYVPGIDYWKASTCGMCPAGCGIIVRTREHKANKIEGNPLHPVNRGALCARGQAGLEVLYNPDRIKGPMKRMGERGEGKWEEISWEEAIKTLADRLRGIKESGNASDIIFATSETRGITGLIAELFTSAIGSPGLVGGDIFNRNWEQECYRRVYGSGVEGPLVPIFDIANAQYVLSFGARFLEAWHSPVMYSLEYGEFRRSTGKIRGKFIQIEPRMSLTGANADEWLPAAVGTEALVALSIAAVIVREGLVKEVPAPGLLQSIRPLGPWPDTFGSHSDSDSARKHLEPYGPEAIEKITGIGADKITRIAREFASSKAALALGMGTFEIGRGHHTAADRGIEQAMAINYLNLLAGNLNKPGGVQLTESFDPLASLRTGDRAVWMALSGDSIAGREVKALLLHDVDPVYLAPRTADQIKTVPFIVSFSSFMNDSTQLADLVLPDNTYLESWDVLPSSIAAGRAASLTRPVVSRRSDSRQTADVLLALARELGTPLPFESAEEAVKQALSHLTSGHLKDTENADKSWDEFIERGVWIGTSRESTTAVKSKENEPLSFGVIRDFESKHINDDDYPLTLLTYEHGSSRGGAHADFSALKELPDPMTSAIWGSWVEINPQTARDLGINEGDLVEVRTTEGAIEVPAFLYRAIRPDLIAMPYGEFGARRGHRRTTENASLLNPALSNPGPGSATVRARVTKSLGSAKFIRFGTDLWQRMENRR
jgi:anaerobic selenocysteine-containing dehydrogenase